MRPPHPRTLALAALAAGALAAVPGASATPRVKLFVTSAQENADQSVVTLPLHRGTSHGKTVWYVILDASDPAAAASLGVNYAPKIANVAGTAAVQQVNVLDHAGIRLVDFPATVDFSPVHKIQPGPTGFPPAVAQPGAVGEPGYSPFIELPDGTVLDAPQVANGSGKADKVVSIDTDAHTVQYRETEGRYDHHVVHYISFDASAAGPAAIEDVTYAPALAAAPTPGDETDASSREGLVAFTNGQTGADNPQRQGLSSALLDGLSPLNILHEVPERNPGPMPYSPLWEPRLAEWTPAAIAAGRNVRQDDFATVLKLAARGLVTGPGGTPFGASGFDITCPVISENLGS